MPTKEIKDFPAVVTPAGADLLVTQQDADSVTRKMTVTQTVQAVDPKAHKALHQNGGADEISVLDLSGLLADAQTALAHALGSAIHNADTLAAISSLISDGTIILASQAEAEAGTEATKRMTPLRVAQAILVLGVGIRSGISGLVLANNVTDETNDIDIRVGETWSNDAARANRVLITLTSARTKRIDAAWVVGTNQGGMDTGAVANDNWYHIWLIKRTDTGVVDALFSLSATAPTMPTNYDKKHRIGAVRRDTATNRLFFQTGDEFLYKNPPALDHDASIASSARTAITVSVPTGLRVLAFGNMISDIVVGSKGVYFSSLYQDDEAASVTAAPLSTLHADDNAITGGLWRTRTDTAGQIGIRPGSTQTVRVSTHGYYDLRGRDD